MKRKRHLKAVFALFTVMVLTGTPTICKYVDSFRAIPNVAYGGELLIPLIPVLVFWVCKNIDDWKIAKKEFFENHKDNE